MEIDIRVKKNRRELKKKFLIFIWVWGSLGPVSETALPEAKEPITLISKNATDLKIKTRSGKNSIFVEALQSIPNRKLKLNYFDLTKKRTVKRSLISTLDFQEIN